MLFSVSATEVLLIVAFAISAWVLFLRRSRYTVWLTAAAICCALASVTTPADLASTILLSVVFFGCFFVGTKYRSPRAPFVK